jgi:hypothetical protein
MGPGIRGALLSLVAVGALAGADAAAQEVTPAANRHDKPGSADPAATAGSERSNLRRAEGMVVLDYQVIPVPGEKSIDLMGLHVLTKLTDWMYFGVGAYAPLFKGDYGGFMAFDVTAHAQRRIWGNLFANAGLSVGGGGGGKSMQQSKVLSGTGGFVKGYVGLGYDLMDVSVGANVARMKFKDSAIDSTQLNVFVQVPFSYSIGPYASFGEKLAASDSKGFFGDSSETTLTFGLDNFVQIDPEGSNKATIRLIDLQFAHYMTKNAYWYTSLGIGYHGLPLYNQIIGGLGYRFGVSSRVNLHGQLGVGSGGWAPETINTGSGLLIYPKVAAEYAIAKNLSLSLSAGYLFAPKGSSKNYTFGASLNYHIRSGREGPDARGISDSILYRGFRFSVFPQTNYNVRRRDIDRENIGMLSVQFDSIVSDHVYIPIKGAAAYTAYLGFPGYGELLAGAGVQSKHNKGDRLQFFGQLLGGANVHGPVLQAGFGVNYGLNDRLAIFATAGKTLTTSSNDGSFRSDYVGLGMTYRFSVPN